MAKKLIETNSSSHLVKPLIKKSIIEEEEKEDSRDDNKKLRVKEVGINLKTTHEERVDKLL